jgi:hypothetical protein
MFRIIREIKSFEMVFANQFVFITGEACFFYVEVGQPSHVELSFFNVVRKTE